MTWNSWSSYLWILPFAGLLSSQSISGADLQQPEDEVLPWRRIRKIAGKCGAALGFHDRAALEIGAVLHAKPLRPAVQPFFPSKQGLLKRICMNKYTWTSQVQIQKDHGVHHCIYVPTLSSQVLPTSSGSWRVFPTNHQWYCKVVQISNKLII